MCMDRLLPADCIVTSCGHLFCKNCIEEWVTARGKCPNCTQHLQISNLQPAGNVLARENSDAAAYGSKVCAVTKQLGSIWQKEPEAKVIIFVQFEVLLKKMQQALDALQLPCLHLQGTVFER